MSPADCSNTRTLFRYAVTIASVVAAGARTQSVHAIVEVNVSRVGFLALRGADLTTGADVVRAGQWAPVIVDLSLVDQASFDGRVRIGQQDVDGDVGFDAIDVHLRADAGGSQRVVLYALPNPNTNRGRYPVELLDPEGRVERIVSMGELAYRALPSQPPQIIDDDTQLILSISTGPIGRIADLAALTSAPDYRFPITVAHMSPTDLPEHWIGLDAVDYIVWDDARPELLTERQLAALLDWVRHGGTLFAAGSRSAASIKLTERFDAVLPVELGELEVVENLPGLREALVGPPSVGDVRRPREEEEAWWAQPFPRPVPVVRATLRPGASSLLDEDEDEAFVLTRRPLGRGHVIFSAVTLNDLFSAEGRAVEFFQTVFHLSQWNEAGTAAQRVSFFRHVVSAVSFARWGTAYLLLAIVFSLGYVALATVGTWQLLGYWGWRHHSWSAFALVAATAGVLSVFGVNAVRGFGGETLHQISIVDAAAGEPYGYATAFFGIKTGIDKSMDFWVPSDPFAEAEPRASRCFLRPIPVGTEPGSAAGGFVDPSAYRLVPTSASIEDVRVRATLKRFEGRWEGPLGGSLDGQVTVRGTNIVEGSYLVNNLGVDLHDCILLQPALDVSGRFGPRSNAIYAFPLGTLPADGQRISLTDRCYPTTGDESREMIKNRVRLAAAQKEWTAGFKGVFSGFGYGTGGHAAEVAGQEKNALLLLSTLSEHDPAQHAGTMQVLMGYWTCSKDRVRRLDLREQLARDSLMLIGFAEDPGPVSLFARRGEREFRRLRPDPAASWTMYRITIPVTLLGGADPQDDSFVE